MFVQFFVFVRSFLVFVIVFVRSLRFRYRFRFSLEIDEVDTDEERLGIDARLGTEEVGDVVTRKDGELVGTYAKQGIVAEVVDVQCIAVDVVFLVVAYTGTRTDVMTEFAFDAGRVVHAAFRLDVHLDRQAPTPVDESLTAVVQRMFALAQGIVAYCVTLGVSVEGIVPLDAVTAAAQVEGRLEAEALRGVPGLETTERETPFPTAARLDLEAIGSGHLREADVEVVGTEVRGVSPVRIFGVATSAGRGGLDGHEVEVPALGGSSTFAVYLFAYQIVVNDSAVAVLSREGAHTHKPYEEQ